MDTDKQVAFAEKHNITYVIDDGIVWFKAKDVAKMLGYNNTGQAIRKNVSDDDKKTTIEMDNVVMKEDTNTIFITERGIKSLISGSRKGKSKEIAKQLCMDIKDFHTVRKETSTIQFIQTVFKDEKTVTQKQFDNYYVDLYFPKYKICVECDEAGHYSERKCKEDAVRQQYIEENYNVQFVRYDIDKSDLSVAKCIRKIMKIIYE